MGVALENARLFDETKRLLAETDERAAELAVINEIGAALAQQLDFQAIIDLVGERVRSIFEPISMFIALYDAATNVIEFPFAWDAEARTDRPRADSPRAGAHDADHHDPAAGPRRDERRGRSRSARSRSAGRTRSRSSACRS